jgi:hypothetical protein
MAKVPHWNDSKVDGRLRVRVSRRTRRQWWELLRIFRTMYPGQTGDDLLRRMMTNHRSCLERIYRDSGGNWGNLLLAIRADPEPVDEPAFTGPPPSIPRLLD